MMLLLKSAVTGEKNIESEEFAALLSKINFQNYNDSWHSEVLQRFLSFFESEIAEFATGENEALYTHWQMFKKSNFNQSIWDKFIDLGEFSEVVLTKFLTQEINKLNYV